jgi:thiamine-monophosphate kinase
VNERKKIERIAAILGASGARVGGSAEGGTPRVAIGIGDDAAVIEHAGSPLVLTVDEQVEGTHFDRALLSFEDLGWRATMAAASDLAAMGARPLAALSSWVLPRDFDDADVERIAHGQREACDALGAHIVGGNLARGPVVSIATTWVGTCESPITRSGAKPGDGVWLCGALGLAAAGFRALTEKRAGFDDAIRAWRRPRALIAEGLRMARVAHACIDVSDGLANDAGHLAHASKVRIRFDESALGTSDEVLSGGEDYALLCASPTAIEGFVRVGVVETGAGVFLGDRAIAGGFDHFG